MGKNLLCSPFFASHLSDNGFCLTFCNMLKMLLLQFVFKKKAEKFCIFGKKLYFCKTK